jgi:hypothetical protein
MTAFSFLAPCLHSRLGVHTVMASVLFSTIEVTTQVFYRTSFAAALVNLKPLVPGRASLKPAYL